MKKFLSITLAIVMMLSAMSMFAFASEDPSPIIMVDGIASSKTVNTETGEVIFPPSTEDITAGIQDAILPLSSKIVTGKIDEIGKPASEALVKIFDKMSCDENGNPIYPTGSSYTIPEVYEIKTEIADNKEDGYGYDVYFSYDWRLDMKTIAGQLNQLIKNVKDGTGCNKVSLVGFSMGSCVVDSYLYEYGYDDVDNVVILSGGFNGVSVCGDPFSGQIDFDATGLVTFLKTSLGTSMEDKLLGALIDILNQAGALGNVLNLAEDLNYMILDDVFELGLKTTFARFPGLWSVIPAEMYDAAKELLIGDNVSDEFIAKIDYYHDEVQANNKEILDGVIANGGNLGIISTYGTTIPPVGKNQLNIGDVVIDTVYSSFGATCALANSTLGKDYVQAVDCGHNHISADNMIDASTCAYPEYTWFIKDMMHGDHTDDMWALIKFIFNSENQPTVHDNAAYPQFLINIDETLYPLTEENDTGKYGGELSFIEKIVAFFRNIIDSILKFLNISL